jgi:hypothetical protein
MAIGLLFLVVVVAAVVIVAATRSRQAGDEDNADRVPSGLRRFFVYAFLLAALIIAAIGASGLIESIIGEPVLVERRRSGLARSLAFTIIAGPVYLLLGRYVRRLVRSAEERRSLGWGLYVGGALSIALLVASSAAANTIRWLLGGDSDRGELATVLVWGAVWAWHWYLIHHRVIGPWRMRTAALLFGSYWGLTAGAISIGAIVIELADRAYEQMAGVSLGGPTLLAAIRGPLGFMVVGVVAWIGYWLMYARQLPRTPLWHVYVVVGGVVAGLTTVLTAVGMVVYGMLEWWLGNPLAADAAEQFGSVPGQVVVALVGAVVFVYHQGVLRETPNVYATEPGRAERYLLSGVGLLAAAGGLGSIVAALIETTTTPLASSGSVANTLLAGITGLLVGTPLWLSAWLPVQKASAVADPELSSTSRRIYLVALFGLGGVVTLVTLIIIAFQLFEYLLDPPTRGSLTEGLAVPIGLLVSTGAVAAYHWMVWREDRRRVPSRRSGLREVTILTSDGGALADAIRRQTGARVRVLETSEQLSVGPASENVLEALTGIEGQRLLVVPGENDQIRLIVYRDPT